MSLAGTKARTNISAKKKSAGCFQLTHPFTPFCIRSSAHKRIEHVVVRSVVPKGFLYEVKNRAIHQRLGHQRLSPCRKVPSGISVEDSAPTPTIRAILNVKKVKASTLAKVVSGLRKENPIVASASLAEFYCFLGG